ncbi:MAG: DNA polymerase III subunit gamma/tau [Ilumatobacter sp.]|uniref:DNA polymerase III subunit gamma/tau n=1 Tax=Ilumatobacter sp. TaxID=1967498 RepID=UPI002629D5F6|nr:DNA polymerase III subunit gamma/tau [Ilumatobacter sp.]MDJ0767239.1 DNA polymerase III subunit gamma/tau [Ilumatobacter sp.]
MATQALYRRYRPRRFDELKGQDHVVKALRDSVASGREGQAYLFSGPRGTGKTSAARILAKVLNCDNEHDGEPCCECESCLAVERGTSYDVHELDAASNNGVDAIRDLVEKASLGTPGRHKVYILDEVHMLSRAAEAALLKTLEEPPPHVVFVLATTDPQKMSDTIRSRTQHLQFHLLPGDTLAAHVKWVADDAGLDLSQAALDAALLQGGGSARDTLSALELLASTGGDVSDVTDLDEFLAALIDQDAGRILTAMGHAVSMGHDPRTITEDIVRHLRNAFLSLMAPELVVMPPDQLDTVAARAQQLGPATLVRAIERLGSALVDMRHAPDPRILVEVALVQLTDDSTAGDAAALLGRIDRLEQRVKELADAPVRPAAAPTDPATGRALLGGAARRPASEPTSAAAAAPPTAEPAAQPAEVPEPAPAAAAQPAAAAVAAVSVADAWEQTVKGQLKPLVRALYSAGSFVGNDGDTWHFDVPNEPHGKKCAEHRPAVEAALSDAVGAAVTIEFVVGGKPTGRADAPAAPGTPPPSDGVPTPTNAAGDAAPVAATAAAPEADEDIDLGELTDAPPESVQTPIDRLAEAFPGSELISDD